MMQKLSGGSPGFRELCEVETDEVNRSFSVVGMDASGRCLLKKSTEYNMGNAYSMLDEYFLLDRAEYLSCLRRARIAGNLSREQHENLKG